MALKGFLSRACTLLPLFSGGARAHSNTTTSLGIVIFPGYEPLDVWGPLELFSSMSRTQNLTLSIISEEIGLVTTKTPPRDPINGQPAPVGLRIGAQILATHSFDDAPPLDIILVPGGVGNRKLEQDNNTAAQDFVAARYPTLKYLLSVCTGATTLANAGLLEGRRATSSKASWSWVVTHGKNVTWVPSARWVVDGNIWTSSGVSAGLDMVYAFLQHYYSNDEADVQAMINLIEYAPHTNASWDPFSVIFNTTGYKGNST